MKWCPAPACTSAIRTEKKITTVTCSCGFSFCFKCADFEIGDHMPATCEMVEKWLEKAVDESENVKWMLVNTKKCPKCSTPIEKNGGCMHMTCGKNVGGCGYDFCWLCRGPWKDHGSHTGFFVSLFSLFSLSSLSFLSLFSLFSLSLSIFKEENKN